MKIFIVHRLDRDTSGVMIFVKNENLKLELQKNWNEIVKKRTYIGIVEGRPKKDQDRIKSWLESTKTNRVYSSNKPGMGKEAITNYKIIRSNNFYSMLQIDIETGRKNQIRVHMQDLGHSIIGDQKYGSTFNPLKRLGLHAHKLEFVHPITNKTMCFEAEIPISFEKIFK